MNIGQQSFKVKTDQNGIFKLNVENTFDPGLHSIVVKSNEGDKDTGLFYIVQDSGVINKIQTTISPLFLSAILLLLLLVIILSIENIRIGKKIDECEVVNEKERLKRRRYYTRRGVFISVVSIIITLILAILVNNETKYFQDKYDKVLNKDIKTQEQIVSMKVQGLVYRVFSRVPVSGIDLSVDNVSIRLSGNGMYSFDNVNPKKGIVINDPKLRKALQVRVNVIDRMDIPYDANLFNTIISIIDYEAYGKIDQIYPIIDKSITSKYTKKELFDKYVVSYNLNDVNAQKLNIGNIIEYDKWKNDISGISYDNVISVEVITEDKTNTLYFTKDKEGIWRYIYKNI